MNYHGLLWIDVRGLHEISWQIRPDGENRKVERSEFLANLLEYFTIGGVSRVKYFMAFGCFDDKPSPKSGVPFVKFSFGPVANRNKGDFKFVSIDINFFGLCPIQLSQPTALREGIFRVETCYEVRFV